MRIVVPFTNLSPDTVERLADYPAEYVETPSDDPYAYWRKLCGWFNKEQDFLIIEGDKLPTDEQIKEITECTESLVCTFGGFACTKFNARTLMFLYRPHWRKHGESKPIHWFGLDGRVMSIFQWVGVTPHRHAGAIEHHHIGPTSDELGLGFKQKRIGHR